MFFSDETQDITPVEQMPVYVTFEHNDVIAETFANIYPIRKFFGTSLSAVNIMKFLGEYFQGQSRMDTTNVNSG